MRPDATHSTRIVWLRSRGCVKHVESALSAFFRMQYESGQLLVTYKAITATKRREFAARIARAELREATL